MNDRIEAVSHRVQHFLGRDNRDAMVPVFWKLPLVEPKLIKVGLKCLGGPGSRIPSPAAGAGCRMPGETLERK